MREDGEGKRDRKGREKCSEYRHVSGKGGNTEEERVKRRKKKNIEKQEDKEKTERKLV